MNSTNNSKPKTHKGRRKVNMEKMENDSNLQVTFSKRRVGLFKKASELCTLTGSEAAVVVFSPGDKAHSFGHPDVNTVVDRYLNPNSRSDNNVQQSLVPAIKDQEYVARPGNNNFAGGRANHVQQSSALMRDQQYLALVESQIRAEKARGEVMNKMRKGSIIGKLNYQQLEYLRGAVVDFGKKLETQVEKGVNPMMMQYEVVPSGTVIPYDQGATDAGEDHEFNQFDNGYGRGTF